MSDDIESSDPTALYMRALLFASDRIVIATRTGDADTVDAEIGNALRLVPPPEVPSRERALITVLAAQINPWGLPVRMRAEWVRDNDSALDAELEHPLSTSTMPQPAGLRAHQFAS